MAKKRHLSALKKGVAAWNKWRADRPKVKADLADTQLVSVNFKGANFSKTNFSGARITGCDFSDANFQNANLAGSHLEATKFRNADLSDANLAGFEGGETEGPDFTEATLKRADISDVQTGQACTFAGADLEGANLSKSSFHYSDFTGANLTNVNLTGAHLTHCNFTNADLSGARLARANFRGAILAGAKLSGAEIAEVRVGAVKYVSTDDLVATPEFSGAVF